MLDDFNNILGFFEQLKDLKETSACIRNSTEIPLREDNIAPYEHKDALISRFPESMGKLLKVPKVIE
ncbi:Asp-tRNA(Asn)/Glu-tRNA(Gln) amidotransferase subunit GatC [Elusimicrobiota bacterium]